LAYLSHSHSAQHCGAEQQCYLTSIRPADAAWPKKAVQTSRCIGARMSRAPVTVHGAKSIRVRVGRAVRMSVRACVHPYLGRCGRAGEEGAGGWAGGTCSTLGVVSSHDAKTSGLSVPTVYRSSTWYLHAPAELMPNSADSSALFSSAACNRRHEQASVQQNGPGSSGPVRSSAPECAPLRKNCRIEAS
jgi:hypothetical protein